ncbi:hypothetical protein N7448_001104 [Penicillium atrosanguineum]|uniref:EthD domain-containing protein n=1 Tax=Penicillium atrosanguineum TaxID=1132637 RepID=A0A9W9Q8M9_9EURO|nr:uncharacterized protein N7443_004502 [Penicillium atrosanguineum]KAJ5133876.1 hypothetical protein N7526_005241 [Penicillium atrosanguineum]KAJ5149526.1 hypothetical protein N7448_001104 [Penicillium atrosanguineum]KAJ5304842.1 hypothetical protein N7443_004502 [Penicillium atrosanguineum]KAJ5324306.1 hypothetical protein N7476_002906 [Penicillium atrosanguineum]
MPIKVLTYAYRKHGISLGFQRALRSARRIFEGYSIFGDESPLSHKRSYIARYTIDSSTEGVTNTRNASTPARAIVGQQSDFDFDAYAELMSEDQIAYDAFLAKVFFPEAAAEIAADEEKSHGKSKLAIVTSGDVFATTK